ncbi:MAG: RluA family pseudouridine synthase [Spirochaetaceae bacterium]|jgi:23S rRNA pseudouridine955/2504/2580 synthase|nr:RluA family pseudouridine synthase [Spirochaetaceae bacterium]
MEKAVIAGTDDSGRRLDRVIRRAFPDIPLSSIHRLLRKGRVMVDGVPGMASARIMVGSRIQVQEDAASPEDREGKSLPKYRAVGEPVFSAADVPLSKSWILQEGNGLLFVNKPAGLRVHGPVRRSAGREGGPPRLCLDDMVRAYLRNKRSPSLSFRPGPLHRLDQVSSGLIVFSTSLAGAQSFSALLRERRLRKIYLALVDGCIDQEETWEDALFRDAPRRKTRVASGEHPQGQRDRGTRMDRQSKPALTRVFPLAFQARYSLVAVEIETGRTHQIRSHAAFHGRPLAGDGKYGGSFQRGGLFLHAFSLSFPEEGLPPEQRALCGGTVSAPLPAPFSRRIREIFGAYPDVPERLLDYRPMEKSPPRG